MLRERGGPSGDEGGRIRRCFASPDFELYVLVEPDGCMFGFQLLYASGQERRLLSWTPVEEFLLHRVDAAPGAKRRLAPADPGDCDGEALLRRLRPAAAGLEPRISSFVFELLHSQPEDVRRCRYCAPRPRSDWHCPRCWLRACSACMDRKGLRKSRCTWTAASHEWQPDSAKGTVPSSAFCQLSPRL